MPVDLSGTWTEVRYEGWSNIWKMTGVDPATLPQVTDKITQTGEDAFVIVSTNNKDPSFRKEISFRVGGNYTSNSKGKPYECTTFWEGDKLVCQGVGGRGTMTRELVDGRLVATVQIGSEVATTIFENQH